MLVFIDTTPFLSESDVGDKQQVKGQYAAMQRIWLDKTLAGAPLNIKWKMVFGHYPVYAGCGRMEAKETVETKNLFKPIFEKYHVNVYNCGHDHHLQYINHPGLHSISFPVTAPNFPKLLFVPKVLSTPGP